MTTATNEKKPRSRTAQSMTTALDDLKVLVRDAEAMLANAGDAADDQIEDLQDRMRAALESSRSRLRELKESAREHLDECDEYVHAHPYQSIGVAVAVGAVLGVLLARRS